MCFGGYLFRMIISDCTICRTPSPSCILREVYVLSLSLFKFYRTTSSQTVTRGSLATCDLRRIEEHMQSRILTFTHCNRNKLKIKFETLISETVYHAALSQWVNFKIAVISQKIPTSNNQLSRPFWCSIEYWLLDCFHMTSVWLLINAEYSPIKIIWFEDHILKKNILTVFLIEN